jgi:membrane associated rhomboid family serine protease
VFQLPGVGRRPTVTYTLLAIYVLVWLLMEAAGGSQDQEVLLNFGAMFGPYIAGGEYWRLLTATFLHVGLMHLVFNSITLLIFGRIVEGVFGPVRFIIVYAVAGLSGSVASFLINSLSIGAGASGAIFGVLGALVAYYLARREVLGEMGRQSLTGLLILAGINLVIGFTTPRIDNWAHIGGFVGGFAVGFAFAPDYRQISSWNPFGESQRLVEISSFVGRLWVIPVVLAVLIVGTWLGVNTLSDVTLAFTNIQKAERFLEQGNFDEALREVNEVIELDRTIGEAFYVRGRILAEIADVNGALSDVGRAIQLGLDSRTNRDAIVLLIRLRTLR